MRFDEIVRDLNEIYQSSEVETLKFLSTCLAALLGSFMESVGWVSWEESMYVSSIARRH